MIVSASFIVVVAFDDGIVCAANSSSIARWHSGVGSSSSRGNVEAEAETEAAS